MTWLVRVACSRELSNSRFSIRIWGWDYDMLLTVSFISSTPCTSEGTGSYTSFFPRPPVSEPCIALTPSTLITLRFTGERQRARRDKERKKWNNKKNNNSKNCLFIFPLSLPLSFSHSGQESSCLLVLHKCEKSGEKNSDWSCNDYTFLFFPPASHWLQGTSVLFKCFPCLHLFLFLHCSFVFLFGHYSLSGSAEEEVQHIIRNILLYHLHVYTIYRVLYVFFEVYIKTTSST